MDDPEQVGGKARYVASATRTARFVALLLSVLPISPGAAAGDANGDSDNALSIAVGDLNVTFVDNGAWGSDHRPGYNGIARMTHKRESENVFVPRYAGFNLEHIFGGDRMEDLFEPRHHPMTLRRISTTTVELSQSPTPLSSVESTMRFTVTPPHYIDVRFRCIARDKAFFRHGYMGLFWASYINVPKDRRMYFRGFGPGESEPRWISAFSERHGQASTHRGRLDPGGLHFAADFNAPLANHFSDYRFDDPFFYGRFRDMVLVYMFDRSEGIRFSQSPTGGGDANPAWDFQLIVPDFEIDRPYGFRSRVVYKPFLDREDVIEEYRKWRP